jgi:hypothetical protein
MRTTTGVPLALVALVAFAWIGDPVTHTGVRSAPTTNTAGTTSAAPWGRDTLRVHAAIEVPERPPLRAAPKPFARQRPFEVVPTQTNAPTLPREIAAGL